MKKRVLVTGGARGLGRAISLELARLGYNLVIHYNSSEKEAKKVQDECLKHNVHVDLLQGDLSTKESTEKFIEEYLAKFSTTYALVNNVGNYLMGKASDVSLQETYELFETNFFAPFILSQKLIPALKKEKGCIVNIGCSGIQSLRVNEKAPLYSVSKLALLELTRSLAKELAPFHVRVNMVSPGRLENSVDVPSNDISKLPMGRLGTLKEVAHVVTFFLDPINSYVTGQNIEVAGGFTL